MTDELRTVLYPYHVALGAQMVPFGGWRMPLAYPLGILKEHLSTRRQAGLFDVSHMGRFEIHGRQARAFLQRVLSNDVTALTTGQSHYTFLPDEHGGALDDAYLFRFVEDRYLLVVNAANRNKDWAHLMAEIASFPEAFLEDRSDELAMLSLQGPESESILAKLIEDGPLPVPRRNATSLARCEGTQLWISRTGYTGEPCCFELCLAAEKAPVVWQRCLALGAQPVGLGARDTLRLEAGLPLYGHELGRSTEGTAIPIFALSLARFAVSFSPEKGAFIGKEALRRQFQVTQSDPLRGLPDPETWREALPRRVRCLEMIEPGIARAAAPVFFQGRAIGFITSGTMVPYWHLQGEEARATLSERSDRRAIALALIDSDIQIGELVQVDVRGKKIQAGVMPAFLSSKHPPYARAITWTQYRQQRNTP